jgi:hypothetical protein
MYLCVRHIYVTVTHDDSKIYFGSDMRESMALVAELVKETYLRLDIEDERDSAETVEAEKMSGLFSALTTTLSYYLCMRPIDLLTR